MNAHEFATTHGLKLEPTGSRHICDPPVMDTDVDYAVLVDTSFLARTLDLAAAGWEMGGSVVGDPNSPQGGWVSYRKGEENLILFGEKPLYECFLASTAIAKRLNLRSKEDRITLFGEMEVHWPGMKVDFNDFF